MQDQYKPVHAEQREADRSIVRIRQLMNDGYTSAAMAQVLQEEGYVTIRGRDWTALNVRQVIFKLRAQLQSWYALSARRANFVPCPAH